MRRAIASAEVADEQRGADPTTNLLQERVAELLGQEAALFLPSGTMCNQISFRLHARPGGDEMILDRTAHPIIAEAGGPAQNSQLMIHALDGDGGIFTAQQVEAAVRDPANRYLPRSRVVSVEQTTNMGGGRGWARAPRPPPPARPPGVVGGEEGQRGGGGGGGGAARGWGGVAAPPPAPRRGG